MCAVYDISCMCSLQEHVPIQAERVAVVTDPVALDVAPWATLICYHMLGERKQPPLQMARPGLAPNPN